MGEHIRQWEDVTVQGALYVEEVCKGLDGCGAQRHRLLGPRDIRFMRGEPLDDALERGEAWRSGPAPKATV